MDPTAKNCDYVLSAENFIFVDFFSVWFVTGSNVKVGKTDYTSIWHVLRSKNSLRNCGNTRNNEKVVYFSVANTVSYQRRWNFRLTRYITIFLRRIQSLKIFKIPRGLRVQSLFSGPSWPLIANLHAKTISSHNDLVRLFAKLYKFSLFNLFTY